MTFRKYEASLPMISSVQKQEYIDCVLQLTLQSATLFIGGLRTVLSTFIPERFYGIDVSI
jgi:hypothetical protein